MRRDRAVLREAQFGTPREAQFHSGTAGQIRVDIVMPDKTAKREYFYEHDKAAEISGVSIGYLPGLIEIRTSRVAASGYARQGANAMQHIAATEPHAGVGLESYPQIDRGVGAMRVNGGCSDGRG
jgi:hypothetical protein